MIGALPVDGSGALELEEAAVVERVGGWPLTAAGKIAVSVDPAAVVFDGGLPRDAANGRLAVHDGDGVQDGGALRHASGALCIAAGGAAVGRAGGFPVDADGRIVTTALGAEFPANTTVLDDFNRADVAPLGAPWDGGLSGGSVTLRNVSNQVSNAVGSNGDGRLDGPFGPDVDLQIECAVALVGFASVQLWGRMVQVGPGTTDGYMLRVQGNGANDDWAIFRIDNGSGTVLGALVASPTLAVGNRIGLRISGSTLEGYKFSGGVWSLILSRSDGTHAAAGSVGLQLTPDDTESMRFDNLLGGTA